MSRWGASIFFVWAAGAALAGSAGPVALDGLEPEEVELRDAGLPVAIAPDGALTATVQDGREGFAVEGWGCKSCTRRFPVPAGVGPISALALAAGGRLAATGHEDGTVIVWDLGNRVEQSRLALHRAPVRALALSPTGRLLASLAPPEPMVPLVDVEAGTRIGALPGTRADHRAVAFSPDGRRIAVGSAGQAEIWKVSTLESVRTIPLGAAAAEALAFGPEATLLAIGTGSAIRLAESETGKIVRELRAAVGAPGAIAFSADGRKLAGPGPDRELWVWEIPSGTVLTRSHVFDAPIAATGFLEAPARVAWGGGDVRGLVRLE